MRLHEEEVKKEKDERIIKRIEKKYGRFKDRLRYTEAVIEVFCQGWSRGKYRGNKISKPACA